MKTIKQEFSVIPVNTIRITIRGANGDRVILQTTTQAEVRMLTALVNYQKPVRKDIRRPYADASIGQDAQ